MRIALEARALSAPGGGIKRYVKQLIKQLQKLQPEHEVKLLPQLDTQLYFWKWLQRDIPRALDVIKPDVVHFTKVDLPRIKKYPTVVTIYDVIPLLFPESQNFLKRFYWPRALKRAATLSDHIITISEASKRDIIQHLHVDASKITVTPLAIDHNRFKPATALEEEKIRQKYSLNKPFIFFVSTIEPRKNVPALIRSFTSAATKLPHDLVIAGRFYRGQQDVLKAKNGSAVSDRIKIIDFVETADLPVLYSAAAIFVLPSVYEGWGLPALEAMACGAPVIVSDGGSLPEVVGSAGEIIAFSTDNLTKRTHDEQFEKEVSKKLIEILNNPARLQEMHEAGLQQAQKFSWHKVAEKTIEVYKKVV